MEYWAAVGKYHGSSGIGSTPLSLRTRCTAERTPTLLFSPFSVGEYALKAQDVRIAEASELKGNLAPWLEEPRHAAHDAHRIIFAPMERRRREDLVECAC